MRAMRIFLLGMLAGAGGLSLANYVFQRTEQTSFAGHDATGESALQSNRTDRARVREEGLPPVSVGEPPATANDVSTPPEILEPRTDAEWNALVGGMLEWEVDRMGERLSSAQRDRLVSELARLREASLALQELPAEPDDPAELRERLARTLTLAQVDEAFREELGVGVAEFVHRMDPAAVEDVSRPSQR